jgi:hypothetical protein
LLYINKKETEPALDGKLTHAFQDRSIRLPDGLPHSLTAGPTTDVSGFLAENIARYRQAVKEKFPERFAHPGERALYKANENQLDLDFSRPPAIPLANTPENFRQNFQAIAGEFKTDTIEAARFLLRAMQKEDREAALADMRGAGCTDRESYHKYLYGLLPSAEEKTVEINEIEKSLMQPNEKSVGEQSLPAIDWNKARELELEGKTKRNDERLFDYLEKCGVPKELVKQAFLWAFGSSTTPNDFTEGLKLYIERSGHLYGYEKTQSKKKNVLTMKHLKLRRHGKTGKTRLLNIKTSPRHRSQSHVGRRAY